MKKEDKNNKEMIKLIQDIEVDSEIKNTDKKYPKIIMCLDEQTEEEKQLQEKEFIPVDLSFQHLYPFEQINWADLRPYSKNDSSDNLSALKSAEAFQKIADSIINERKSINIKREKVSFIYENLIDNFSEGAEERLKRSPIFYSIFHSLLSGQSPYKCIEDLCNIHDNMCIEHSKQMMENVRPVMKVNIEDLNGPTKLELMSLYGRIKKPEYKRKNLENLQNPDNND